MMKTATIAAIAIALAPSAYGFLPSAQLVQQQTRSAAAAAPLRMVTFTEKTLGDKDPADVLDVLEKDHKEAKSLVQQAIDTSDPQECHQLTSKLVAELVRHSVAEETFVYPLIEQKLSHDTYQKDLDQHQALEEVLQKLEQADANDPNFKQLLQQLQGTLDEHVSEEEGTQFKVLREKIDKQQLINLKDNVEFAKVSAPQHAHPGSPRNGVARFWSSPVVGAADKIRDAVTDPERNA